MALIFDIETNGLLPELTKIHCIVLRGPDGVRFWEPAFISEGLEALAKAPVLVGHNAQGFDIPAIQKLYPTWKPEGEVFDTMVMSRLMWPDTRGTDFNLANKNDGFPKQLIGRHSLEAWGWRLKVYKDVGFKQTHDFTTYSQEMLDYCIQDTAVTQALFEKIRQHNPPERAVRLEHAFARILDRQMARGFLFDTEGAKALVAKLMGRRAELDAELCKHFPPFTDTYTTPKKKVTKTKTTLFNPNSRDHIARALMEKYGWKPDAYTDSGKVQVDESIIEFLPYPEAPMLAERLLVQKRLGQLAEGAQALLSNVKEDGRIHGFINHNGTVTGRCSHSNPNLGQVPSVGHPYGREFRALFGVLKGHLLVGCDASGLELRCLAHYMARYDNGAYGRVLTEGDIHTANQEAAGLPTRDSAKTFIYAFLYGAGDEKIGTVVGGGKAEGHKLRARFLKKLPALKRLQEDVQAAAKDRGFLKGLDGRPLQVRSQHAALNVLLQSAGAVVMKQATVFADEEITKAGLEAHQVAHVHDEFQFEVRESDGERVGAVLRGAIQRAGESFDFRCPLDGKFKVGKTWADTH